MAFNVLSSDLVSIVTINTFTGTVIPMGYKNIWSRLLNQLSFPMLLFSLVFFVKFQCSVHFLLRAYPSLNLRIEVHKDQHKALALIPGLRYDDINYTGNYLLYPLKDCDITCTCNYILYPLKVVAMA